MADGVIRQWHQTARSREVVRRSFRVALLVGTILVAINYTDRLLAGQVNATDFVKRALTFAVPYCVSTYASVSAILKRS